MKTLSDGYQPQTLRRFQRRIAQRMNADGRVWIEILIEASEGSRTCNKKSTGHALERKK